MKTKLLNVIAAIGISGAAYGQCAVTSAPNNNCNYFSTQITAFSLNNIASNHAGCGTGGYIQFNTPVRQLLMGNTYNWSATTGNGYYSVGFAMWIDLDGDGFYAASEMVATSPPSSTHSGTIFIPFTATPGTNRPMRIRSGWYSNISGNQACTSWLGGYGETEDYLVDIISPPPCTATPFANTVVVTPSTGVCLNASASLSLAGTYTNFGYTYQWGSSTVSPVGPFTAIPNATTSTYQTPPITGNVYYQATITCVNAGVPTMATSGYVQVQGTTISQVPYIEDFEGITKANSWPNCSWSATNPTTIARTYTTTMNQQRTARSGNKFASFYYSPSGTNYVYTNGIQLYAGVTYSAGVWFKTNNYGDLNWTDMSLMLGTSQSSAGLVTLASTNGPAASIGYKALSNTFTVSNSGIYYVAVKASNSGGCCAMHLNWDDLSVTAPCSLNQPSITLTPNSMTVCNGSTVNILASGNVHTFTWSTGETGNVIYNTPGSSTNFTVVGTNSITGCSTSQSQYIQVVPAPNVIVYSDKNNVCAGQPANLTAIGANSYTWHTGQNSQYITVNPNTSTTYSVSGMNNAGCAAMATQYINVYPLPTVTVLQDREEICKGESTSLTGQGADTYQWMANTLFINAATAVISPNASTTYTLVGTDNNGCTNSTTIIQSVTDCVGLNNITTTQAGVKVYPNPSAGTFVVELQNTGNKLIEVTDLTGRSIISRDTKEQYVNINISHLSNGIYYVKIRTGEVSDVIKVVKQ